MAKTTQKSTKRFGPRYGRTVKTKVDKIESMAKTKYKCPYCNKSKVTRQQAGIWKCNSCEKTFTGKAYQI